MYVVCKSINHGKYKAITKPFFYMLDAENALQKIKSKVQDDSIVKDIDDRAFVCFRGNLPTLYKVVKDDNTSRRKDFDKSIF